MPRDHQFSPPARPTRREPVSPPLRRRAAQAPSLQGNRRRSQPLRSAEDAKRLLRLVAGDRGTPLTAVVLLDAELEGNTCFTVEGTEDRAAVVDVAALTCELGERSPSLCAVVMASVRPGQPGPGASGLDEDDIDCWFELAAMFWEAGIELFDWYLIAGPDTFSVRDAAGQRPRWPESCPPPGP